MPDTPTRPWTPPPGGTAGATPITRRNAVVVGHISDSPAVRWMRSVRKADAMHLADGYQRTPTTKWEGNSSLKELAVRTASKGGGHTGSRNMARRISCRWMALEHRGKP